MLSNQKGSHSHHYKVMKEMKGSGTDEEYSDSPDCKLRSMGSPTIFS